VNPLQLLFNYILDSRYFPKCWSSGIIIPLHKKGDSTDPSNYRGITITSCFAKFFTVIINNRLKKWSVENDKITDAQFGFKADYSTVDAIFIFHSLIEKFINDKKKIFCCFIDFKKAYDLIDRNCLWYKLIKCGIDGKLFSVIYSMYEDVKLCVKHVNTLSEFFSSEMGLFQGEITSPIMFSLFLNDLENSLQENLDDGITLDQISIYLLLFADDAVICSESAQGLQNSLNSLEKYCNKWHLTVNVDKTKIVVFRKGGVLNKSYKWIYGGLNIEIVKTFNYLGPVLSSESSFIPATNTLKGKELRAMSSLFNVTRDKQVPIDIMFNLFDAHVLPILNYTCEVWCSISSENLEIVHRKFFKWLLNVKMSINTLSLFAEVGRFPLNSSRHVRIVKYFIKYIKIKQAIVY
jgi:hypothetical protein